MKLAMAAREEFSQKNVCCSLDLRISSSHFEQALICFSCHVQLVHDFRERVLYGKSSVCVFTFTKLIFFCKKQNCFSKKLFERTNNLIKKAFHKQKPTKTVSFPFIERTGGRTVLAGQLQSAGQREYQNQITRHQQLNHRPFDEQSIADPAATIQISGQQSSVYRSFASA